MPYPSLSQIAAQRDNAQASNILLGVREDKNLFAAFLYSDSLSKAPSYEAFFGLALILEKQSDYHRIVDFSRVQTIDEHRIVQKNYSAYNNINLIAALLTQAYKMGSACKEGSLSDVLWHLAQSIQNGAEVVEDHYELIYANPNTSRFLVIKGLCQKAIALNPQCTEAQSLLEATDKQLAARAMSVPQSDPKAPPQTVAESKAPRSDATCVALNTQTAKKVEEPWTPVQSKRRNKKY